MKDKKPSFHLHHEHEQNAHAPNTVINHIGHSHGDCRQLHEKSIKMLKWVAFLTFGFALVEYVSGHLFNSLALMSDAAHMITDSSSLLVALIMAYASKMPADHNHSYGHGRAEVLGALFNSLFMVFVIAYIFYEAIDRFYNPTEVKSVQMLVVASLGLVINIVAFLILQKDNNNMNIKAALIHVVGDLLGSIAAIISAIIIYYTNWNIVDTILSILICIILMPSTVLLFKRSIHILLEGVPEKIDIYRVGDSLSQINGVDGVHDLHVWTLDSKNIALSAHISMKSLGKWQSVLNECEKMLYHNFNIVHTTLQPELIGSEECKCCFRKKEDRCE